MPDEEKKPSKLTKKQKILIACASGFVALLIIVLVIVLCLNKPADNNQDQAGPDPQAIDYSQKVVSVNGEENIPTYVLGESSDLQIQFVDLSCTDEACSNVSVVQLNDKLLVRGEDYQVTKGSIIITILNKVLRGLKVGEYSIVAKIDNIWVGVKVRIDASDCTDKQGECYSGDNASDEPDEAIVNGNTNNQPDTVNTEQSSMPPQIQESDQSSEEAQTKPNFNLNENYTFTFMSVQWLLSSEEDFSDCFSYDEQGNTIMDVESKCPSAGFTTAKILKDGVVVSMAYIARGKGTSSQQQFEEEQQKATTEGYRPYVGMGLGEQPLTEDICNTYALSCGRW